MMRARANTRFHDRVADVIREEGEEFECTKARFDEIVAKFGHDALVPVSKPEPKGKGR